MGEIGKLLHWLNDFLPSTSWDWAITILTFGLLLSFLILGWRNRITEHIRSRFWSTIGFGGVGLLVAGRLLAVSEHPVEVLYGNILPAVVLFSTGALITIILSLRTETHQVDFHVIFIYEKNSKKPLEVLDSKYFSGKTGVATDWSLLQNMVQVNPTYPGPRLYLDVLLRMVMEFLFMRYKYGWLVQSNRLNFPQTPGFSYKWRAKEDPLGPTHYVWEDCERWFGDTPVFRVPPKTMHPKLAVPAGTTIEGKTEYVGQGREEPYSRTLCFDNNFVSLNLSIEQGLTSVGIGVPLRNLLGYSKEQGEKFISSQYHAKLTAKFKPLRSEHPVMPRMKEWVQDMFDELQAEFDARKEWERQKEYYT